jgi:hypothetical protein
MDTYVWRSLEVAAGGLHGGAMLPTLDFRLFTVILPYTISYFVQTRHLITLKYS